MSSVPAASVEDRIGVYKRLVDVPDRYLLSNYAASYSDRNVWSEYLQSESQRLNFSDWRTQVVQKAGRHWKEHMDSYHNHPALADPIHVEHWCESLLETRTTRTVYEHYWVQLEQFYSWLQSHSNHPHVYNPVLMAVVDHPHSQQIWEQKVSASNDREIEFMG